MIRQDDEEFSEVVQECRVSVSFHLCLERLHFVYTVDLRCGNHLAVVELGCGERSEPHRTVRGGIPVSSPVSPA
ncbi:protein of unknown function [Methylocaldum szegediense]|uniref:Uncharacterized protein n=1 Tax=Methylocaldum szegediense TaxID=73780 RepID=A0ABN8X327_9GAMM|nr:protein of unknown function [Methylocaldum szegediense]